MRGTSYDTVLGYIRFRNERSLGDNVPNSSSFYALAKHYDMLKNRYRGPGKSFASLQNWIRKGHDHIVNRIHEDLGTSSRYGCLQQAASCGYLLQT